MIYKQYTFVLIFIMFAFVQMSKAQLLTKEIPLIPAPESIHFSDGVFLITSSTVINFNDKELSPDIDLFYNHVFKMYNLQLVTNLSSEKKDQQINIFLSPNLESDVYQLTVDSNGIFINAGKNAGVFYALQTLIKLLPVANVKELSVPHLLINDKPRFNYRGMHLDVSRHFYPVEFIKKYLDYLAMYKMNYFHWHLTDDQGWRIEIKKYPLLQKISAWRNGTRIGHLYDQPVKYDSLLYGGFYTQEEIKEIIQYATQRHITIIPEIEMPGHALAALAAYPELSCNRGPFEVGRTWGVFKDVFCPREETFIFLQNVLDEVIELFPGKYIHIGGDECPKDRWKNCSSCQALIKKEDLDDENGLQRYFTNRIATYLRNKNKTTIGWDEILEKGLDSDALIMSYRGYKGGTDAAVKGHDVVMSPASHCYFDMYQSRISDGRIAIGGYLPIDQVYSFEPVPDVLNEKQSKHIIGAQGNVWTEYIKDEARVEEMIFPRMAALSEVLWSPKKNRDFSNFSLRLVEHFKFLDFLKINYSTAFYDISSRVSPNGNNGVIIELFSNYTNGDIYYTLNAGDTSRNYILYDEKIVIDHSLGIQAFVFDGEKIKGKIFSQLFNINKATGKEINLVNQPHAEYNNDGSFSLVNGVIGNLPWIPSEWLGFSGKDLDATIDLGKLQSVSSVEINVLKDEAGKIFLPKEIKISVSDAGNVFKEVGDLGLQSINKLSPKIRIQFPEIHARWIKVFAKNYNDKDWLFVDEISVQ